MNSNYRNLGIKLQLIVFEMLKRNIGVEIIDEESEVIKATYLRHEEIIKGLDLPILSSLCKSIAKDKVITKKLLNTKGISTVSGVDFALKEKNAIIRVFDAFRGPLVLKRNSNSFGKQVYLGLHTLPELDLAITKMGTYYGNDEKLLLEEYVNANLYKIYVDSNNNYGVLYLEPPYIIGNGIDSIRTLIVKNCIIYLPTMGDYLNKLNLSLDSVIGENVKLYLSNNRSIYNGAKVSECKKETNSSLLEVAMKVRSVLHASYIELDVFTDSITQEQSKSTYKVLKINTEISIDKFMKPDSGASQNIAKYMVDLLFPETKYKEEELEINIKSR